MADRPFLVGLTGSIGMGKTETAKMFAQLGIPVYDADVAVHQLYEPGGAAVAPIAAAFPGTVVDGRVDRAELTKRVTADKDAFKNSRRLSTPLSGCNSVLFWIGQPNAATSLSCWDIPLLFETGGHARMDAVVVVSAPHHVQRARVLQRPGMTVDKLDHILSRQVPDAEKRAQAHFVVEIEHGLDHAFEQVRNIVAALHQRRLAQKEIPGNA